MLTSLYIKDFAPKNYYTPPPMISFLPQILADHGYATGASVSCPGLNPDVFSPAQRFQAFYASPPSLKGKNGEKVTAETLEWISQQRCKKTNGWFFWAHYYDAHAPYRAPEPFHNETKYPTPPPEAYGAKAESYIPKLKAAYCEEINYLDHCLTILFEGLKKLGEDRNLIVIAVGDHGEGFGEHGVIANHHGLYEEVLRVPFIFVPSNKSIRPKIVRSVVQTIDIFPTLLDMLDIPSPAYLRGSSLVPLLKGDDQEIHPQIQAEERNQKILMIRQKNFKFIYNLENVFDPRMAIRNKIRLRRAGPEELRALKKNFPNAFIRFAGEKELYDLSADPCELKNLLPAESWRGKVFADLLKAWQNSGSAEAVPRENWPKPTQEQLERLRALGY